MDVLVERYQRRKYVNQEDAPDVVLHSPESRQCKSHGCRYNGCRH